MCSVNGAVECFCDGDHRNIFGCISFVKIENSKKLHVVRIFGSSLWHSHDIVAVWLRASKMQETRCTQIHSSRRRVFLAFYLILITVIMQDISLTEALMCCIAG